VQHMAQFRVRASRGMPELCVSWLLTFSRALKGVQQRLDGVMLGSARQDPAEPRCDTSTALLRTAGAGAGRPKTRVLSAGLRVPSRTHNASRSPCHAGEPVDEPLPGPQIPAGSSTPEPLEQLWNILRLAPSEYRRIYIECEPGRTPAGGEHLEN